MSQQDVDLVRDAYDDFNSGNVPGVLGRLHPDVDWVEPGGGNSPAGTMKGPDSVANDVFGVVVAHFDEFACTVDDARDEGDSVVMTVHFTGRSKSGAELDTRAQHLWEVQDGKVTRFENKPADPDAWARGWS